LRYQEKKVIDKQKQRKTLDFPNLFFYKIGKFR
jgi:hypothetical protein